MSESRAYVSHSIRGAKGNNATWEDMEENNKKATEFGKLLKQEFPNIDFYIPGEHDEFVVIAYREKYMTEEQILDVDCKILDKCDFHIIYAPDDYIGGGIKVEIDYSVTNNIPVISAIDGDENEYTKRLIQAIRCFLVSYEKTNNKNTKRV